MEPLPLVRIQSCIILDYLRHRIYFFLVLFAVGEKPEPVTVVITEVRKLFELNFVLSHIVSVHICRLYMNLLDLFHGLPHNPLCRPDMLVSDFPLKDRRLLDLFCIAFIGL